MLLVFLIIMVNLVFPWMMTSPTSSSSFFKIVMIRMMLLHLLLLLPWTTPCHLPAQVMVTMTSLRIRLLRLMAVKLFNVSSSMTK